METDRRSFIKAAAILAAAPISAFTLDETFGKAAMVDVRALQRALRRKIELTIQPPLIIRDDGSYEPMEISLEPEFSALTAAMRK